MGAMLDKQSASIRNEMKAQAASMRSDMQEDLAAPENQLGKSWSEELVPLKKEDIRLDR